MGIISAETPRDPAGTAASRAAPLPWCHATIPRRALVQRARLRGRVLSIGRRARGLPCAPSDPRAAPGKRPGRLRALAAGPAPGRAQALGALWPARRVFRLRGAVAAASAALERRRRLAR